MGNVPEPCIDRPYVQLIQRDFGNSDKESDYDKDKANIPFQPLGMHIFHTTHNLHA